jgi:hypothetical protein
MAFSEDRAAKEKKKGASKPPDVLLLIDKLIRSDH